VNHQTWGITPEHTCQAKLRFVLLETRVRHWPGGRDSVTRVRRVPSKTGLRTSRELEITHVPDLYRSGNTTSSSFDIVCGATDIQVDREGDDQPSGHAHFSLLFYMAGLVDTGGVSTFDQKGPS
jgi:hypothetical protein